jgi:hypothetical protein
MENKNELAVAEKQEVQAAPIAMDDNAAFLANLTTAKPSFCSMHGDTPEDKKRIYNAMNNPDKRLGDCINETIEAKDVFVEVVECVNKETGEMQNCPRVVLVDVKGCAYQCVSVGIFSALSKIFRVYGVPTWEKPIKLKVKQITKSDRKLLTLEAV